MKRNFFCLFTAALLLCGTGALSAKNGDEGVTINGVMWATRNVGAKGKFTKKTDDVGRYYTFEEAQSACPKGWRTPTTCEFDKLIAADSEWTSEGEVNGRRFGSGDDTIFIPAAGASYTYEKSSTEVGQRGHYWSSDAYSDALGYDLPRGAMAYTLRFDRGSAMPIYHNNRAFGYPVRCVKQ